MECVLVSQVVWFCTILTGEGAGGGGGVRNSLNGFMVQKPKIRASLILVGHFVER